MHFNQLGNEERRRLIDVQQRAEALRLLERDLKRRFAGTMAWKARDGRDYLYRRTGAVEKSMGARSTETEGAYQAFVSGKAGAGARAEGLRQTLEGMARVNRAMGLGRIPNLVARILRRLDAAGVLGTQVCVAGTNALFAYEARVGVQFDSGLLATADIDVALDARRNLALAGRAMPEGLLGLLRRMDASFAPVSAGHVSAGHVSAGHVSAGHFSAVNAAGFMVDLIAAEPRHVMRKVSARKRRLGAVDLAAVEDLLAAEVPRLEMIVDAPRIGAIAIAEDGLPVWLSVPDPRWWAAHKLWLGQESERDPIKRRRDLQQGEAVAQLLAVAWADPDLSDATLASIPTPLRERLREAVADAADQEPPPVW